MTHRELLIALAATERIHRTALCRLAADPDAWQHLSVGQSLEPTACRLGVPTKQLRRALEIRNQAPRLAAREVRRAERRDCRLITRFDEAYPSALLDLHLPPPLLYCRGSLSDQPAIAMVGSRRMDDYGKRAARLFAERLAGAGVTVVSGFARGIDTTAHRAALDAGGSTVAVLGCGIDIDYPSGNAPLAAEIRHHGAILSEFPFGCEPRAWRFPVRNRVIAALSLGTLVIQAAIKSGSLITAHHALDLGRDVYAVPGRIFDPSAAGTNALIADGALPAHRPRDILESLSIGVQQALFPASGERAFAPPPTTLPEAGPSSGAQSGGAQSGGAQSGGAQSGGVQASGLQRPATPPPNGFPGKVYQALSSDRGLTVEEIATQLDATVEKILGALLELELVGRAHRAPGPVYLR